MRKVWARMLCWWNYRNPLLYKPLTPRMVLSCSFPTPQPQISQVCRFGPINSRCISTIYGGNTLGHPYLSSSSHGSLLSWSPLYPWGLVQGLPHESSQKYLSREWILQAENKHLFENGCHRFMLPKWMLTESTGCLCSSLNFSSRLPGGQQNFFTNSRCALKRQNRVAKLQKR